MKCVCKRCSEEGTREQFTLCLYRTNGEIKKSMYLCDSCLNVDIDIYKYWGFTMEHIDNYEEE